MATNDGQTTDLDLIRAQMVDILQQIRYLPGKRNAGRRMELWRLFREYAAEAKRLEARPVVRKASDILGES